jgi:AAA+ superfamily predicted ATPase
MREESGRTARIVTGMADGIVGRGPASEAPRYDRQALKPEDQAVVDYWMARTWRPDGVPGRAELADRFVARWTGTQGDGAVTTVSRVWPAWQLDNLAHAWAGVRSGIPGFDWEPQDTAEDALAFRQVNRPAYGSIETGYRREVTACLRETLAVRAQGPGQTGLVVRVQWDGSFGPAIEVVCHEQARAHAERLIAEFCQLVEASNIYRGQHLTVQGSRIKFTRVEPAGWDDVIVPADVLGRVKAATVAMVDHRDQLARYGMGCGHAIILSGRPGTGKSFLSRAIATAMGSRVTTWVVTAKAFYSASGVTEFYDMVRAFGPALVVFEDIDLIGQARQYGPTLGANEILGELLTQMSGLGSQHDILTVASTNRYDVLDEALTDRPERVGARIDVPVPGPAERRRLFDAMARRYRTEIAMTPAGWHEIVRATDGFTGDWIRATVAHAVRAACTKSGDVVLGELELQGAVSDMVRDRASTKKSG